MESFFHIGQGEHLYYLRKLRKKDDKMVYQNHSQEVTTKGFQQETGGKCKEGSVGLECPIHVRCKKILLHDMNKSHSSLHEIVFHIKHHIETTSLISSLYCKHILLVYLSFLSQTVESLP